MHSPRAALPHVNALCGTPEKRELPDILEAICQKGGFPL